MTQMQSAPGADLEAPLRTSGPDAIPPGGRRGRTSTSARDQSGATSDQTVSAIDRLIARIETGTATPEDVDDLPDGVIEYLHAALTLSEMGALDGGWEVTPSGGILVRDACR